MSYRTMYDSVALLGIPRPLPKNSLVAYYTNGRYYEPERDVATLFPTALLVPIDVNGTNARNALTADIETGDLSPGQTEQWITDYQDTNPAWERRVLPLMYCDRSDVPLVRMGTGRYVLNRDYLLWVATGDGTIYGGSNVGEPGVAACQYLWSRTYDESTFFDSEWTP